MRVSTKGRYGLMALVHIAHGTQSQEARPVSVKSIAEKQGISENYLEQIIAPLKKAAIVRSVRGANGGYYLARCGDGLTAAEVLRILEGPLVPVDCVIDGINVCGQVDCELCVMKPTWNILADKINEVMGAVTIGDLARDFARLTKERESR